MLRKSDRKVPLGDAALLVETGDFGVLYPTVWSFMTQSVWDDGSPRQTSSVTLFVDDGQFKCVLKDRDTGLALWVAAPSVDGLFAVLDASLSDPKAVWRTDRRDNGGTAKRVKRGG